MTNYLIEKGTNYSYLLNAQTNPTFESIRKLSVKFVMQLPEEVKTFLWEELENGVQVLDSEGQLSMYMHAYGKMHLAKLIAAFEHLPMSNVDDINLVDWGCGQGTATIAYFDYLNEKGLTQNVKSITLIEPSELAIKRAALHAQKLFPNAKIHTLNKRFNEINADEIPYSQHETLLHFFSNILDVEEFEIEDIATKINCEKNTNYMVCVGPLLNDRRNQRMIDFVNYFSNANLLAEYENNEWHCGWKINYKVLAICNDDEQEIEEQFTETVTDIDGNVYKTVRIGNQVWMAENLRVSRYRNGDLIPNIIDNYEWQILDKGAWCNYDNNTEYDAEYGKLYNWLAIYDERGFIPDGWHIPTNDDWWLLIKNLGGDCFAGGKLKEIGFQHWDSPNEGCTNKIGFCALPGGCRDKWGGEFMRIRKYGYWLSDTEYGTSVMDARCMSYDSIKIPINQHISKKNGISVRCIKDEPDDSFKIVWKNGYCGFKNSSNEIMITPFNYDDATKFIDGLACVKVNSKWGIIDKQGREISEIKYSSKISFSEGFACVSLNGKYGFIDKFGQEVIAIKYEDGNSFHEGLASVKFNGKYGFIDKQGDEIIPFEYDNVWLFSEGLACVEINDNYGFINKKGSLIIAIKYERVYSFTEGLAAVRLDRKWGFIDKKGNEIIPIKYDSCRHFNCGLASVKLNKRSVYIDKSGEVIIDLNFYVANSFDNDIAVVCTNGIWKIINKSGNEAFKLIRSYDWVEPFKGGLAQVKFEKKYGYIDTFGNEVIPIIYDFAHFNNGLANVNLNGLNSYLDKNGNEILPFKYSFVYGLVEGLRKVGLNSKYGFIDDNNNEIIPLEYDDTRIYEDGLCAVELNNKWGYINKKNEIVIPIIYDYAGDFYCGHAKIELNNKSAFINKKGKVVTPFKDVDNSWYP